MPMTDSARFVFIAGTVIVAFYVWHYGRAGINGILKRKMRFRGLTSWQFSKFYELEGDAALICRLFFCCRPCSARLWLDCGRSHSILGIKIILETLRRNVSTEGRNFL